MAKGKILGIDYGAQSIGLAVSDIDRQMAFGRGVLKKQTIPEVLDKISRLIVEEGVNLVLVGLPMGLNGQETSQTAKIRQFTNKIEKLIKKQNLGVPIEFIDESFSSFEANTILETLGVKGRDKKTTEDEMAAIILIHRYIDFRP